jgi:23S rRNA pseudouridine1911/1915/1917 synthase
LGDPAYGAGFASKARRLGEAAQEALSALGRQALHAETLGFSHPLTGAHLVFRRPPPADMSRLIDALRGEPPPDTRR